MSHTKTTESQDSKSLGGKYLTFALGREEYGLPILAVREIFGFMESTAVPHTPKHVCGVINLRGQVISVVDLRARFDMPQVARTEQTCIIVVEIKADGRAVNMGIVVDRVSEVLNIPAANIEQAPSFGASLDMSFVLGMGKVTGGVKILLNIDKILTAADEVKVTSDAVAA